MWVGVCNADVCRLTCSARHRLAMCYTGCDLLGPTCTCQTSLRGQLVVVHLATCASAEAQWHLHAQKIKRSHSRRTRAAPLEGLPRRSHAALEVCPPRPFLSHQLTRRSAPTSCLTHLRQSVHMVRCQSARVCIEYMRRRIQLVHHARRLKFCNRYDVMVMITIHY